MGKSNFEPEAWKESAKEYRTPTGEPIKQVMYLADGTLIPLDEKHIEVFAGKFPTLVIGGSSWCRVKKPSAVLAKIDNTKHFVLYLCCL